MNDELLLRVIGLLTEIRDELRYLRQPQVVTGYSNGIGGMSREELDRLKAALVAEIKCGAKPGRIDVQVAQVDLRHG